MGREDEYSILREAAQVAEDVSNKEYTLPLSVATIWTLHDVLTRKKLRDPRNQLVDMNGIADHDFDESLSNEYDQAVAVTARLNVALESAGETSVQKGVVPVSLREDHVNTINENLLKGIGLTELPTVSDRASLLTFFRENRQLLRTARAFVAVNRGFEAAGGLPHHLYTCMFGAK